MASSVRIPPATAATEARTRPCATNGRMASDDTEPIDDASSVAAGTDTETIAPRYKGKALRWWPQLPAEIVRLIANYHLEIASASQTVPLTWEMRVQGRRHVGARMVFLAARDTATLESLMCVCPQWGLALETHSFWNTALNSIDPHNQCPNYAWLQPPHSSAAPIRLTPYHHFRNLFNASCLPCLINAPFGWSHGLTTGRRTVPAVPRLGPVTVCKSHADRRTGPAWFYCGVCLRDGELARRLSQDALRYAQDELVRVERALQARHPSMGTEALHTARDSAADAVRVAFDECARLSGAAASECMGVNEDDSVFRGVHSTCKSCRTEWLWRQAVLASESPSNKAGEGELLLHALGASKTRPGLLAPQDSQVRDAVMLFLDLAEGTIPHVLGVATERGWLRTQTRWAELMGQAVAARRLGAAAETGNTYAVPATGGRRRRARSVSPASIDGADAAYANNAVNAAVYTNAGYTRDSYDLFDEETAEYEEEEEDSELDESDDEREATSVLEVSVTEMAVGDWARGRILEGVWVDPADVWYGADNPDMHVKAIHPVPWAVSPPPSPASSSPALGSSTSVSVSPTSPVPPPASAPAPAAPPPPTYALAEAAHAGHTRQLRALLLPAFRNIVRRIVVESALDAHEYEYEGAEDDFGFGEHDKENEKEREKDKEREKERGGAPPDPAMRAARLTLGDVVRELREEEGVWFDGVDWRERRKNARADEAAAARRRAEGGGGGSDDSSEGTARTAGSGSGMSDSGTVHSTPTLGTTPTPPPVVSDKGKPAYEQQRGPQQPRRALGQPTIAVMPVLHPPRLLRPIPHVPETIAHLPPYSIEALKSVWREACAPLYHCRCTVCERAMAAQQAAQGGGGNPVVSVPPAPAPVVPASKEKEKSPLVVHLPAEDDAQGLDVESVVSFVEESELASPQDRYWLSVVEEEDGDRAKAETEASDDFQDEEEHYDEDDDDDEQGLRSSGARKRSVDELESEESADDQHPERGGTPPKRARTGERGYGTIRLVKRRSEELDGGDDAGAETPTSASDGGYPHHPHKRARSDVADSPPASRDSEQDSAPTSASSATLAPPASRSRR